MSDHKQSAATMTHHRQGVPNHDPYVTPTIEEICGRVVGIERMSPVDATLALEAHRRARLDAFTDALKAQSLTGEQHAALFAWYDKHCTANWFRVRSFKVDALVQDTERQLADMKNNQVALTRTIAAIAEPLKVLDSFDGKYGANVVQSKNKNMQNAIRGVFHRYMSPAKYGKLVAQAAGQDPEWSVLASAAEEALERYQHYLKEQKRLEGEIRKNERAVKRNTADIRQLASPQTTYNYFVWVLDRARAW